MAQTGMDGSVRYGWLSEGWVTHCLLGDIWLWDGLLSRQMVGSEG